MHLGRRRPSHAKGGNPNSIRLPGRSGGGTTAEQSLTAAGFRVRHQDADKLRRLIQPWQERAFAYYDRLGEIKYASQFYSRMLSPLRLYVEKRDPSTGEWNEIDGPSAAPIPTQALERIQDPGGGREALLSSYGRLVFLAGEGYLLCSLDPESNLEQWEFLSTDELRIVGGVYMRYRSPSLNAEEYKEPSDDDWEPIDDDHAVAYRLWRRHPRYCADEATEILSERGWMRYDELRPGTRVLTLNHESGLSEWQPVESVNLFSVEDEPMISVEGAAHSSLTTLEHRWPTLHRRTATNEVERYWTTSERLNSCDQLVTGVACADLPLKETFSDDFVEAVAWFYTEGSIAHRYRSAQVSICQSNDVNPIYVDRIRSALGGTFGEATTERMSTGTGSLAPPRWREYHEPSRGHVYFWLNTAASEELLAVAPEKVVSLDFIRALTREQLDLFVETSLAADGHGLLLAQKDARRLRAFELACILSGRSPHTYALASGMTMTNARERGSCLISSKGRSRRMKPQTVLYSGTVWCPTTKNGTWLARREGTVYYTGNSMLADSTMMGVLDLCEELLLLTLAVRARARSRLASAGILLVSDAIDYPAIDPVGDEDSEEDPFVHDLTEAMTAPMQNEGSPSAVVPLVVVVPEEVLKNSGGIKFIQIVDPTQLYPETGLRRECIERIAIGLDMPPEILLGMADANHWCQTADTEVLTLDHGWVSHERLAVDDLVRTVDHGTGLASWESVLDIYRADVRDLPMVRIDGRFHDSLSTPNHRWPVLRNGERFWTTSEELKLGDRILRAAPAADIPAEATYDDSFIELVAWFVTEGTCTWPSDSHCQVRIGQSHRANPDKVARIRATLSRLYGDARADLQDGSRLSRVATVAPAWREDAEPRGMTLFHLNKNAYDPLLDVMESRRSKVVAREFILSLTSAQLELFLRTVTLGDGSANSAGGMEINQRDSARLAPIELAAILAGHPVQTRVRETGGFKRAPQTFLSIHSGHGEVRVNPSKVREELYTGTIWCPRTPSMTWLARRNGKVFFTGNTVWMIDEQTWKAHGQPVANQLVNDLNAAYFYPQLRADGMKDWQDYRIAYDASAIINHPDRTKDAKDLYDREAIGKAALRDAGGFTEDDAMPDDELAERIGIKTHDSSLAWFGEPAPRGGAVETAPGEVVSATGTTSPPEDAEDAGPTKGAEVEAGPPSDGPPDDNEELTGSGAGALATRIVGAADVAVLRARESAGNRLRSLVKRDRELAELVEGVWNRDVAWTLGHERARPFASATELVACAGDLIRETLRLWGVRDKAAIELIGQRIEQHAARTLFDKKPSPMPAQFRAYVVGVLEGK